MSNSKTTPTLNPLHAEAIIGLVNKSGLAVTTGIIMTKMSYGHVEGQLNVTSAHHNAFGGIHGGMYAALIDHMAFYALYTMLEEDMGATSLDLHTDYLRSCAMGLLTVSADVVKKGGKISLVEVDILDEKGRLMAHGTSKMLSGSNLQSAADLVANVSPGLALPAKFL